jgi:hypothetical protein
LKSLFLKLVLLISVLAFAFVFCYRISQAYGPSSQSGYIKAMILTVFAGIAGLLPVIFTYTHKKVRVFFAAIMIGTVIRMFITAVGILLVIYLLKEQRTWFLGWSAGFYLFFLALDTCFVVYFLNKRHNHNKGSETDGNAVLIGKYESS